MRLSKSNRNPKTRIKHQPRIEKYKSNLIYKRLTIYNDLPKKMRLITPKEFKKKLKRINILTL